MRIPTTAQDWDRVFEDSDPAPIARDPSVDLLALEQNRFLAPLIRPGIRALEAGCGKGKLVRAYARRGASAIGIDFSVREMGTLHGTLRSERLCNASLVAGDLFAIPLASNSLDLYSSFGVYEHFLPSQHPKLFKEARRVLKPDGLIYVEVPHRWSLWTVRRELRYWYRAIRPPALVWQRNLSRRYLTRVAERQGFRTVATHVFDAWTALLAGFSLDMRRVRGIPNPFHFVKPHLRRFAAYCDAHEWMGYSLVYIGRKPT
jgi:SAM-dependent methyltransferase